MAYKKVRKSFPGPKNLATNFLKLLDGSWSREFGKRNQIEWQRWGEEEGRKELNQITIHILTQ
jgi:hypothetical protein